MVEKATLGPIAVIPSCTGRILPPPGPSNALPAVCITPPTTCIDYTAPFPASGTTLIVDVNMACPGWTFTTIQAAVNAASPGDTIEVCPGAYVEQVTIPAGLDGLRLIATPSFGAVIFPPAVMVAPFALVHVDGAFGVLIDGFQIVGSGVITTGELDYGILVNGGGTAVIQNNIIANITDVPPTAVPRGIGINVDIGRACIQNNIVVVTQQAGIRINGSGSIAQVINNIVFPLVSTSVTNGIQISRGAMALVVGNIISANITSLGGVDSTGILVFEAGLGVQIIDNSSGGNVIGIALVDGSDALVCNNELFNNSTAGIFVDATYAGARIQNNSVTGNPIDLIDDSIGLLSCCTSNIWISNTAATDNRGGCLVASTGTVCTPLTPLPVIVAIDVMAAVQRKGTK